MEKSYLIDIFGICVWYRVLDLCLIKYIIVDLQDLVVKMFFFDLDRRVSIQKLEVIWVFIGYIYFRAYFLFSKQSGGVVVGVMDGRFSEVVGADLGSSLMLGILFGFLDFRYFIYFMYFF